MLELYIGITALAHTLLAAGVGAHTEVSNRRTIKWVLITLLFGVFGLIWYALSSQPDSTDQYQTQNSVYPQKTPEEWDRPRSKRLVAPNSLHIDLPNGMTLTPKEQKAVSRSTEYLENNPDATTKDLYEEVFPNTHAQYTYPDVWWTDLVYPALETLPEVSPPSDGSDHLLSFSVRPVDFSGPETLVEVSDGTRSATFEKHDDDFIPVSGAEFADTSAQWVRLAQKEARDAYNISCSPE